MGVANAQTDGYPVVEKPLRNLDYAKLRRQKKWLLQKINNPTGSQEKGYAMGLLNLVDSIQEYACEELGKDPATVWGKHTLDDPLGEEIQAGDEYVEMEEAA